MDDQLGALRNVTTFGELRALLDVPDGMRGKSVSVRQGSLEMNYFAARAEIDRDAAGHGFRHLADAVAAAPGSAEVMAVVDEYDRKLGLAKLLPPESQERYYATEALRALSWARSGRVADAIDLLLQVHQARPTAYVEVWVLDWLGGAALDAELTLRLLGTVLNGLPEAREMTALRAERAKRWARVAIDFMGRGEMPSALAPTADMMTIGLCRKAGSFEEGLGVCDAAIAARPSWHAHAARGLLLRQRGDVDGSRAAFDAAIAVEPDNFAGHLEAGDTLFDAGRYAEALGYYDHVLASEPGHAWAEPSALFCRWRTSSSSPFPDQRFPAAFYDALRAGNHRAHGIFDRFRAFHGFVPPPRDATANAVRQLLVQLPPEKASAGNKIKLQLSDVEPPSNQLLVRAIYGDRLALDVSYGRVATPDPRAPHAEIAHTLWRREGEVLVPALAPPSPRIAAAIRRLSTGHFDSLRAWSAASRLARDIAPNEVRDVLACLVHPLPLPDGAPIAAVLQWVPTTQLHATFVLAQVAPEEPWETSVRRAALLSLLHGPMDWATEAAIVALGHVAVEDPLALLDVHKRFAILLAARPTTGAVPWEETLYDHWLSLPGLYDPERQALIDRAEALRQRTDPSNAPS